MDIQSGENNGNIGEYQCSQSEYNHDPAMFMQPFLPPPNFAPYFYPAASVSRPSTPTSDSSTSSQEGKKSTRTRVGWGNAETRVLIDVWAPQLRSIKCASQARKKEIWADIHNEFSDQCKERSIPCSKKTQDQIKKRVKNLEYEYRQVRTRLLKTGEEGANKIKKTFVFFEDLDVFLGTCEGLNPELMTIEGTNLTAEEPQERETQPQDNCAGLDDAAAEKEHEAHDGEPAARKGKVPKKRKPSRDTSEEDPYLKNLSEMWRISMEKQTERFERGMEVQKMVIESQMEQTKALMSGLKDILKECVKD